MPLEFEMPKDSSSILKVIGVGGGGSNAVNHMYLQGIKGVDFMVCNTDLQALDISPVPLKIQIGQTLTGGRGAGAQPEVGRNAAVESIEEIKEILANNTTMVFITAGMGGGTGTGAAPVIAQVAKEMGILTVGIVSVPFKFEGPRRNKLAQEGLEKLRNSVDTLLIIKNDKLRELYGNLSMTDAFHHSDNILTTAAKGIAEVISSIGYINVDMNDVNTVMKDSGVAIMGSAQADGENRAQKAVSGALESPLLNDSDIRGARHVLLNITFGSQDITMDELDEITAYIQAEAGDRAEVIMGYGQDDRLGEAVSVTIIATGFEGNSHEVALGLEKEPEKTYRKLDEDVPTMMTPPLEAREIQSPLTSATDMRNNQTKRQEPQAPLPSEEEEPFLKEMADEDIVDQPIQQDLGFDLKSFTEPKATPAQNPMPLEEEKQYFSLFDETQDETEDPRFEEQKEEIVPLFREQYEPVQEVRTAPLRHKIAPEDHRMNTEERMERIKEYGMKLRTPSGLSELEKEPAYKRKNLELEDVPHSSESNMSRYTLNDSESEGVTLSKNNPYLDKHVD
ncbi:MAG: cell division protein FtsZ [Bacteroidetes bacterium]|nr:cell division protein FtsZ [Bacteroidota bacterium]